MRDAEQRRRRRRLTSLGLLVVLVAAGGALARSPLFAISSVEVEGVAGERAEQVRAAAGIATGENLLFADLAVAGERVALLPWVGDVQVRRRPPATVVIAVGTRRPAAVLRTGGASWLLDAEGVLLAGGADEGLPEILAGQAVVPAVGRRVADGGTRAALEIHAALPQALRPQVVRYHAVAARDVWAHLESQEMWIRFGPAERAREKGRVVAALLAEEAEQAAREGRTPRRPAEIDVRAPANPVVVPGGTGPAG